MDAAHGHEEAPGSLCSSRCSPLIPHVTGGKEEEQLSGVSSRDTHSCPLIDRSLRDVSDYGGVWTSGLNYWTL